MHEFPCVENTIQQMIDERLPNLFRLYVNPAVAQACYCLASLATGGRDPFAGDDEPYQVFLANGHDEAISGALKLARFARHQTGCSSKTLLLGPRDRIAHFASTTDQMGRRIHFLPDIDEQCSEAASSQQTDDPYGVVIDLRQRKTTRASQSPGKSFEGNSTSDRTRIQLLRREDALSDQAAFRESSWRSDPPEIVLFDDSWVNREIPFAAFAARASLFQHWRQRSMSTFHSTTFQPNTISSLHFLRCFLQLAPLLARDLQPSLDRMGRDAGFCEEVFRSLYSPSLTRLTRVTGFDAPPPKTDGHAIESDGRRVLDCVAGVACSIRGHNPASFLEEMRTVDPEDPKTQLGDELNQLTGFPHYVLSGSGAAAVEIGLKMALASQPERDHVLALRGGFAGKTLFALTATDSDRLRYGLDPLYRKVVFLDPHREDSYQALSEILDRYPIGVVQTELVQAVGGVRPVPRHLLELIDQRRYRDGFWLLVDEVQTGMYRTGSVTMSKQMEITPDILTLGKGTSDMMVPSSLTLYSSGVHDRLGLVGQQMVNEIARRHDTRWGHKTVLNTLRFCERADIQQRVDHASGLFEKHLCEKLKGAPMVADVRIFGLLIGIELRFPKPLNRFRSAISSFYLLSMLQHHERPVLSGFCQHDRGVLKVTPPLTIEDAEIEAVCETIAEVLRRPPVRVALAGLRARVRSSLSNRKQMTAHAESPNAELQSLNRSST